MSDVGVMITIGFFLACLGWFSLVALAMYFDLLAMRITKPKDDPDGLE